MFGEGAARVDVRKMGRRVRIVYKVFIRGGW